MSEEFDPDNRGQVILYRANGVNVPVEVTYWRRTFWMPQKNIARLFGVNVPAVSKHLANIYAEGELAESATMSEMEIVRNEGGERFECFEFRLRCFYQSGGHPGSRMIVGRFG